MNKSFIWFLMFSMLLVVSCGSENDDDDDPIAVTPPVEEEEDETPRPRLIRYSAFEQETVSDMFGFVRRIRADFNRRPLLVSGTFSNVAEEAGDQENCSFQIQLSETQARALELSADRLRFCTNEGDGGEEPVILEDRLVKLTTRDGGILEGSKDFFPELEEQTWLCRGKANFYSRLRRAIRNRLPDNCPENALNDI